MGKVKIDKADRMFSLYIRTRDGWKCKRCGNQYTPPTSALHCSHFKGRGKENTRFDERNADALCYGCHRYFTAQPDEHYKWQLETKGQKVVDDIIRCANTYKKKDRETDYLKFKTKLSELESL